MAHDVSIRIAVAAGDRRCVRIVPASNVSMTCMRPPQQGQGLGSVRGPSVRAAAVGSGLGGGGGHSSSSRALAMAAGTIAVGKVAVVADAVETLRERAAGSAV
jgi:hypothetical protein